MFYKFAQCVRPESYRDSMVTGKIGTLTEIEPGIFVRENCALTARPGINPIKVISS